MLILIMTTVRRYELAGCLETVLKDKHGFCYLWLLRTSSTIPPMSLSSMSAEMHALMGRWISALFDSMGISDDLIQYVYLGDMGLNSLIIVHCLACDSPSTSHYDT